MAIQFIDLCSGIGGFHSGLMATGHFMCVGHAEIMEIKKLCHKTMIFIVINTEGVKLCQNE